MRSGKCCPVFSHTCFWNIFLWRLKQVCWGGLAPCLMRMVLMSPCEGPQYKRGWAQIVSSPCGTSLGAPAVGLAASTFEVVQVQVYQHWGWYPPVHTMNLHLCTLPVLSLLTSLIPGQLVPECHWQCGSTTKYALAAGAESGGKLPLGVTWSSKEAQTLGAVLPQWLS